MKNFIRAAAAALSMLLLLLSPRTAAAGAKTGLLLWYRTVLPTLLPFLLCSTVLVQELQKKEKKSELQSVLFCLLAGICCGCPMGPKTAADLLRSGCLSLRTASVLTAVSAFPGPMFLAGYVLPRLSPEVSPALFLLSLYLPALPMAAAAWVFYRRLPSALPAGKMPFDASDEEDLILQSAHVMVRAGVSMTVCSAAAAFTGSSPLLTGLLEMTCGIRTASRSLEGTGAAALILFILAFGSCSAAAQVNAVIKNAGLSIRHYVLWKLIHASLACAFFILLSALPLPLSERHCLPVRFGWKK